MTTKVVVTCPDNSHWPVKVITQDLLRPGYVFSNGYVVPDSEALRWQTVGEPAILKPTERHETYIHNSRRLVIEEVPTS